MEKKPELSIAREKMSNPPPKSDASDNESPGQHREDRKAEWNGGKVRKNFSGIPGRTFLDYP